MSISKSLLPEFDHEMASTRKLLERVPDDRLDFKPHERSMPMTRLASHIAEIPGWAVTAVTEDELDFAPPGGPAYEPIMLGSRQEMLDLFDDNVARARAAIETTDDATYFESWALKSGGRELMTMPKIAVLRSMVMNHMIHHRGQLTVYFRLNDVPIPSTYGPTADERDF